jgi:PAS domain-containing protein
MNEYLHANAGFNSKIPSDEAGFPFGGGGLGALIRALDWSKTCLGPIAEWPAHLKATISIMLPAEAQIVLFWGPEFVALYNDAYAPTIGDKHPRALGRPARENWEELWDDLEPLLRRVLETGETVFAKDRPFYIERHGYPENVYFDISYSPVYDEAGEVGGVLCIVRETTDRFVARRELARAQERLTQALNAHGMVGTFDWHAQTDVVYSDARFGEMFSVDPARAEKGAPLAEYLAGIHPDDVEWIAAAVNHVIATGEKYIKEFRLLQKDGTIRWVEARGECLSDEDGKPVRLRRGRGGHYQSEGSARASRAAAPRDEPSGKEPILHHPRNDQIKRPVSPNSAGFGRVPSWSAGCPHASKGPCPSRDDGIGASTKRADDVRCARANGFAALCR